MNFKENKKQKMQDPEFRKAYENLGPENEIIRTVLDGGARKSTTLDRYIHLFQNSDESISDLMEPLFDMSSRKGLHAPVPGYWSGDGDGI